MQSHPTSNYSRSRKLYAVTACIFALCLCSLFVLTDVTWAETRVSGSVSGIWDDSLYIVEDHLTVEQNQSLVIRPGVVVRFDGDFRFDVSGLFRALGTIADPITIYADNQWQGMHFNPESNPNSILDNCILRNAWVGVECEQAFVTIRFSTIEAVSIGIKCLQSSPVIINNRLIKATGYDSKAISIHSASSPLITGNQLIEASSEIGDASGIWIENSTAVIQSNWIEANAPLRRAIGIYVNRSIKVIIEKNIIRLRSMGDMRNIWLIYGIADIISNDLFLLTTSETGVCINVDQGSEAQVTNNILYGNGNSIGDKTDFEAVVKEGVSGYNDYYNHREVHVGNWNGNHDIQADPKFVNHSQNKVDCDYTLTIFRDDNNKIVLPLSSPCIDTGSPDIQDDLQYGTLSDIGRYPYIYDPAQLALTIKDPVSRPVSYDVVTAFPNPFNRSTTLTFDLALPGQASILVFDMNGRQLSTLWNGPLSEGSNRLVWSAEGFSAGEYLIRLELPGSMQTERVLFLP